MSSRILTLSDEDEDLIPADSKGLNSIFDIDKKSNSGSNPSLQYTAPKQPKSKPNKETSHSLIYATAIQAQQYIDGQYANKARLSFALLGNAQAKEYVIVLYKGQNDKKLVLKLEPTFNFNVKENNYVNFYDENRQAWAIKFDTIDDLHKTAEAIALAKANITALKILLFQNLTIGEGQSVTDRDTVGIYYTGWTITNGKIDKENPFDTNTTGNSKKMLKFKIGDESVMSGLDQGMHGIKKGGKKLILIPAHLAKGGRGKHPPNTPIAFEVELVKVKFANKENESDSYRDYPPPPTNELDMESYKGATIRERASSLTENSSDGGESTNKSAIINRISKMGQQMIRSNTPENQNPHQRDNHSNQLPPPHPNYDSGRNTPPYHPPHPNYPHQHTPSYHESHYAQPFPPYHQPHLQLPPNPYTHSPHTTHNYPMQPNYPLATSSMIPNIFNQPRMPEIQTLPPTQILTTLAPPIQQQQQTHGVSVGEFSQLMADTRVELGKINIKLDDMGKRISDINDSQNKQTLVPVNQEVAQHAFADPAVLASSINRMLDDNTNLKREITDREARIEGLNHKVKQLLETNQRYVEQSQHLMEQRSDSLHSIASSQQSQMHRVEQERDTVVLKYEEAKRQMDEKSLQFTEVQQEIEEVRKKYENLYQKMNLAKEKFREKESEIEDLKNESDQVKREADKNKSAKNTLQNDNEELNANIEELKTKIKQDKGNKIKLENKIIAIEEEFTEIKEENDQLQKTIEEKKRKQQQEKQKYQREIEELRSKQEEELSAIQSQLNITSSSPSTFDLTRVETSWKKKLDQAVAEAEANYQDQIEEIQGREEKLKLQVLRLEKKVSNTQGESEQFTQMGEQILELQDDIRLAKERYSQLQKRFDGQDAEFSERLEVELKQQKKQLESQSNASQIDLTTSIEESKMRENILTEQINELQQKLETQHHEQELQVQELDKIHQEQLNQQFEQHQLQLSKVSASSTPDQSKAVENGQFGAKVKQVMNLLFAKIKSQFSPSESYPGTEILTVLMKAIREETINALEESPLQETAATNSDEAASSDFESDVDEHAEHLSIPDTNSSASNAKQIIEEPIISEAKEPARELDEPIDVSNTEPIAMNNTDPAYNLTNTQETGSQSPLNDILDEQITSSPKNEEVIDNLLTSELTFQNDVVSSSPIEDNTFHYSTQTSIPNHEKTSDTSEIFNEQGNASSPPLQPTIQHDPLVSKPPSSNPLSTSPDPFASPIKSTPSSLLSPPHDANKELSNKSSSSNPLLSDSFNNEDDFFGITSNKPTKSITSQTKQNDSFKISPTSNTTISATAAAKSGKQIANPLFDDSDDDEFDWIK